jgi:hypothetical protein
MPVSVLTTACAQFAFCKKPILFLPAGLATTGKEDLVCARGDFLA